MKRTKTNAAIVALIALAVSTSAFAAPGTGKPRETGNKDKTTTGSTAVRPRDGSGLSGARAQVVRRVTNLHRAVVAGSPKAFEGQNLSSADTRVILERTSAALSEGLLGARGDALVQAIEANPSKAEFVAIYTNYSLLAARNKLTSANLKWTENIDGKTVEINANDFITGEALMVAKGSSPKFVKFMNIKTQLEKEGKSTREAMIEALKELEISWEDFVRRCLLKA